MTNRPEKNFTYWFGSLYSIHAIVLLFLATLPLNGSFWITAPEWNPIVEYTQEFRLLNTVAYLLSLPLFFTVVHKFFDARTAFYCSCVLMAGLLFSWQITMPSLNGLAAVFSTASLLGFFLYLKTNQKKYFWITYSSLGLSFLTSGIDGLIFPIMILFIFLMFRIKMNGATLQKLQFQKGLLFSLAIGLPWLIYLIWTSEGQWLVTESGIEDGIEESAFYLPFVFIILGIIPFGFFLPAAFGYSWKFRVKKPLLLLSALTLLVYLIFYAFSDSFVPHQLLPAFPFAAILTGYQLSQLNGRPLSKMKLYVGLAGTALFAIVVPVGLYILLQETIGQELVEVCLFYLLLLILPLGTIICYILWQKKRMDDGMAALTTSYLLLNMLLIYFAAQHGLLKALLELLSI